MTLLRVQNLNVAYKSREGLNPVVRDVSLSLEKNMSYGIIGESGSGKTTLMNAILRLLNPKHTQASGQVFFNEIDLVKLDPSALNALRWQEIAVVFQNSMNILSPVHRIKDQAYDIYWTHRPYTPRKTLDRHLVNLFGLLQLDPVVRNHYPHELSGGMKQRVSIALSLLFEPQLIILDEATTALDAITQNKILHELKRVELGYDNTKLYITHDLSVIKQVCDYVFIMRQGELVEEGPIQHIFQTPRHPYTQQLMADYQRLIE